MRRYYPDRGLNFLINWRSFSVSFSKTKHLNVSGTFFPIRKKSMC